jgi:serine/threonine protein phosphatase PrpC
LSSLAGERDERSDGTLVASRSHVGRVRVVNEDSCGSYRSADGSRLLVVADGMGGHRGGATASREALAAIAADFLADANGERAADLPERAAPGAADPGERLRRAIESANERVHSMSEEDPGLAGMGTTVVAFLLDAPGRGTVAHVGDSRAYRLRGGRLEALTTDHSVVAEMLRRGVLTAEEAAYHPRRNEILRSVGVLPEVDVEVGAVELAVGDWILLCSDGLCGVVSDAEIEEVLVAAASDPNALETAADDLVALANDCGGPDNVTVQLLALLPGWPMRPRAAAETTREIPANGKETPSAARAPQPSTGAERAPVAPAGSPLPLLRIALIAAFAAIAWWLARSR